MLGNIRISWVLH